MTTATDTHTLNAVQASIAHALASAYNHHWSVLTAEQCVGLTSQQISVASIAACEPGIGCRNDAPSFDGDGNVIHTTGSGRLHWRVEQNGAIKLEVNRPAGDVLTAYLPATAEGFVADDFCWRPTNSNGTGPFALPRHIDAVVEAVTVLAGLNPNAEAVLAWLEAQRPAAALAARWELHEQLEAVRTDGQGQVAEAITALAGRIHSWGLSRDGVENPASLRAQEIRKEILKLSEELGTLT